MSSDADYQKMSADDDNGFAQYLPWNRGAEDTTYPSMKVEDCADAELDRIGQCMSPSTHAAGYYELDMNFDYATARVSVWCPLPKGTVAPRVGHYRYKVHWSKKMTSLTQGWVCMPCLGSFDVQLDAGATVAVEPDAPLRSKPVGAVLMAHGLSGPRFEFAHVAEALAQRGFVVCAPEMEDSGCNTRPTVLANGGCSLGGLTVLRMHQLECCAKFLRRKYGETLKFGLLGYSVGNAAVRAMRYDWPKVHVAGPSPVGKTAPLVPFFLHDRAARASEAPTDAPCLMVLSHADPLSPPPEQAAALAGHDPAAGGVTPLRLEHCTTGRLPRVTMHAFDTLPHPGFVHPGIVAADQGIMQKCSCLLACPSAEELRLARRAAKLLVPLLVRFYEQHLGSRWLPF